MKMILSGLYVENLTLTIKECMIIMLIVLNIALGVFNMQLASTLKGLGMRYRFQEFTSRFCFLAAGLIIYVNYLR
jgi:hypothetical protein